MSKTVLDGKMFVSIPMCKNLIDAVSTKVYQIPNACGFGVFDDGTGYWSWLAWEDRDTGTIEDEYYPIDENNQTNSKRKLPITEAIELADSGMSVDMILFISAEMAGVNFRECGNAYYYKNTEHKTIFELDVEKCVNVVVVII